MTEDLGYSVDWNVLNALDFGLPQKRERVFIVGNTGGYDFKWPEPGIPMTPLSDILESTVDDRFFVSERIKNKRHLMHTSEFKPGLWHENKSGHVSSYPYSCALRAGASYNYLLVDGERRLTPREMFSLQGFPEWFEIRCNDSQSRKQAGNTVAIPVVRAVICQIVLAEAQEETYGTSAKTEATDQAAVPSKSISE
jgi:DNA (cytosine-5)-methyltransferase 1